MKHLVPIFLFSQTVLTAFAVLAAMRSSQISQLEEQQQL